MKYYVECNQSKYLLQYGFALSAKSSEYVNKSLTDVLKSVRNYSKAQRRGEYDYQNSWDCGRQDAFGDKVDKLFKEYGALRIAYKLQRNDATLAHWYFQKMIGES